VRAETKHPESTPRHGEELEGFLRSLASRAEETRGTYRRALRGFLRWIGDGTVERVTPADMLRYRSYLLRSRRLKPASVATYLTAARRFFAFLAEEGRVGANPAAEVPGAPRPRVHTRRAFTAPQLERLLGNFDRGDPIGRRDRAMALLMLHAALTEGEIARLRAGQCLRQADAFRLRLRDPRRPRAERTVRLTGEAAAALELHLRTSPPARATSPLFAGAGNRARPGGLTARAIRERIRCAMARAGVKGKGLSTASLRMTAAMRLIDEGRGLEEVRRTLGLETAAAAGMYGATHGAARTHQDGRN
jgi:site-specific recombinase XerD